MCIIIFKHFAKNKMLINNVVSNSQTELQCFISSVSMRNMKTRISMIKYKENQLDAETYLFLRQQVNWKALTKSQAQRAIDNSTYILVAYDEFDRPVGMGRILSDGAVISYVQDLIVLPGAQGNRIGSTIIEKLIEYVRSITEEGTEMMLCLMCAKGRETFYRHHNFIERPNDDLGPGMIQYISASK